MKNLPGAITPDKKKAKTDDTVDTCTFPDHLVEKIVSLIPFPRLLTARQLSKHWYSSFSSKPPKLSSLQEQIRSVSTNWTTFCPIYVSEDHELVGYDKSLQQWTSLVSLTYFPLQNSICQFTDFGTSFEGSLLCSNVRSGHCCSLLETYFQTDLYITNVITRDWKQLPPRPNMQYPTHVQIIPSTRGAYKVLTVTHPVSSEFEEGGPDLLQIYDSTRDAWELIQTEVTTSYLEDLGGVYLNKKFYVLYRNEEIISRNVVIEHIMVYDPNDGQCTRVLLDSLPLRPGEVDYEFGIVKARGSVMLVVVGDTSTCEEDVECTSCPAHHNSSDLSIRIRNISANCVMVFELDPESRTFKQIAAGPPCLVKKVSIDQMIGHKNRIYLAGCVPHCSVLFYDLQQDKWGCLPQPNFGVCSPSSVAHCFAFEPGLVDPFMPV